MKIPCTALREFYYDKEMRPAGKPIDIDEKDLEILERVKAVERKEEKPKRRYQRRDMTAEGS